MKKPTHPYKNLQKTDLWRVIDRALDDLVSNHDVTEQTRREYIVGYLCKQLKQNGFQRVELRAGSEVRYVVELHPTRPISKAG
jgi:hypothetical protein